MERRFVLFLVLSFVVLFVHFSIMSRFNPPKKPVKPAAGAKGDVQGGAKPDAKPDADAPPEGDGGQGEEPPPGGEQPAPPEGPAPPDEPAGAVVNIRPEPRTTPHQWACLGSADPDPKNPYRMLVTLTSRGAAVARIELASPRYRDLDDRSGHLGHLVLDREEIPPELDGKGCPVQVVGPGTPAAAAGLRPGDLIQAITGQATARQAVKSPSQLEAFLVKTKPGDQVELAVLRAGKPVTLQATLGRRPLEVIRPEADDPLSLLLTLDRFDDEELEDVRTRDTCIQQLFVNLDVREEELAGLDMEDLNLDKGEVRILQKGRREADWVDLPSEASEALRAWIAVRGKQPGPVFVALADRDSPRRIATEGIEWIVSRMKHEDPRAPDPARFLELDGLDLRNGDWELGTLRNGQFVVGAASQTEATFRRLLPHRELELLKTYRLAEVPADEAENRDHPAYHLELELTLRNVGARAHKVAYQLDGPTGLPTEGWWYANKIGREGFFGGAAGMRDVVILRDEYDFRQIGCPKIAKDEFGAPGKDQFVHYIGVDAQYFSAVLIPQKQDPSAPWFAEWDAMRVGWADKKLLKLTDTTCRVTSRADEELKPGGQLSHTFRLFAGPKRPPLLAQYGLDELVYYGWFSFIARPLTVLLHFFHDYVVFTYSLAIILLTAVVRGAMFPLSRKQAIGAQKMQQIQPELKRIQEQYKNNAEAKMRAQQELFRKHNYHPASGCLVMLVQLPIFIALYRALMVDVELRQAPLISESIRWCSNLAAPDMLFDWSGFMPEWVNNGQGIFGLGPYFNLLPILTIVLFIAQQKMFMPPPTDDQAAMQQKIMKYMMIFIGVLFFKVASGLCIYFIASSLWGLGERQFLPKPSKDTAAAPAAKPATRADAKARDRAEAEAAAKARAKARESAAAGDGAAAAARRKRRKARRGKR